jgi:hypothetical protein
MAFAFSECLSDLTFHVPINIGWAGGVSWGMGIVTGILSRGYKWGSKGRIGSEGDEGTGLR